MSETTRDDGGMTGRFLVVNRATGQVVTDVDTWAEAVEIRDGCEEDSPNHAYLIAEAATPPTPDRAAAREAAMAAEAWVAMAEAKPETLHEARQKWLAVNDGNPRWTHDPLVEKMTRALLAAVSRPAEARGERCTNPHNDTSDPNHHCWHARETCCHCETSRDVPAVPRPETGEVSEAMVDDAFILAVEEEVGMGNGAWDMVKASDLCRAVLKVAAAREGA